MSGRFIGAVTMIATVTHAANKAWCEAIGDHSQVTWEQAPEWQRESAINGVYFHLDNPGADAAASHNSWLAEKEKEGWKYGEVKDPDKKEHPCYLPFDRLPPEQQAKDRLFKNVVHALSKLDPDNRAVRIPL